MSMLAPSSNQRDYTPAATTLHERPRHRPLVRGLRAPDALSGQPAGVRRLYWHLAARADPEGYATLNLTALSQQWDVSRQALQYWFRKLRGLRLLQEVDPGGGRGRPKLVRVVRIANESSPFWWKLFRKREEVQVEHSPPSGVNDTGAPASSPAKSPPKPQDGSEPWRKAAMRKARITIQRLNLPPPDKVALENLIGRGLFHQLWPVSVARQVIFELPALAHGFESSWHRGTPRSIYACWASRIAIAVQHGREEIAQWKAERRWKEGSKWQAGSTKSLPRRGRVTLGERRGAAPAGGGAPHRRRPQWPAGFKPPSWPTLEEMVEWRQTVDRLLGRRHGEWARRMDEVIERLRRQCHQQ